MQSKSLQEQIRKLDERHATLFGHLFWVGIVLVVAAASAWVLYIEYGYAVGEQKSAQEEGRAWDALVRAKHFTQWTCESSSYSDDLLLRKVTGEYTPIPISYTPNDLVALPYQYTHPELGAKRVRAMVREPLTNLLQDAWRDGQNLRVNSAYRSGDAQQEMYERYASRGVTSQDRAALPGYSEHQLGTAVDISQYPNNSTSGYQWLADNAYRYGFVLSYPSGAEAVTEYRYEPWHWRYVGPTIAQHIHTNNMLYNHERALFLPSPVEPNEELPYEYQGRDLWVWKYAGGSNALATLVEGEVRPTFYKEIEALLAMFVDGQPPQDLTGDFRRTWVVQNTREYTDSYGDTWQVSRLASFYKDSTIERLLVMYRPDWGYLVISYQTAEANERLADEFASSCRVR